MDPIHLRLERVIWDLWLGTDPREDDEQKHFELSLEADIDAHVLLVPRFHQGDEGEESQTVCAVLVTDVPPPSIRDFLSSPAASGTIDFYGDPRLPFRDCPPEVQQYICETHSKLGELLERTLGVLRWRNRMLGPHRLRGPSHLFWSEDEEAWEQLPNPSPSPYFHLNFPVEPTAEVLTHTAMLVDNGEREPLGHELLREAWTLSALNPRTSVIIGAAAAEVGLKECVMRLQPSVAPLIEDLPSPPIRKLLDYVSGPHVAKKVQQLNAPLPELTDASRAAIVLGSEVRNKLVHLGYIPKNHSQYARWQALLEDERKRRDFLLAVRDLLWVLDVYNGHEWARDHIRTLSGGRRRRS